MIFTFATMKIKFYLLCLLCFHTNLSAQNLLKEHWRFSTGDQMGWADPDYKDDTWGLIKSGVPWEEQGFAHYDGFAWYRQSVLVPALMRPQAGKMGGFLLDLGKVDDVDDVFFNGQKIGHTGSMPPNYSSAYDQRRVYLVPESAIRWDEANVVAIRVYDSGGNGGMYHSPAIFRVKSIGDQLLIQAILPNPDHVIRKSGAFPLLIRVQNSSKDEIHDKLTLTVSSDFKEKAIMESRPFKIKTKQSTELSFPLDLPPGFYQAEISLDPVGVVHDLWFAVSPEEVVSPPDAPADFADFWHRARRELDAVAPQFRMIQNDSLSSDKRICYLVEMRSLGNVLIRGWYLKPRKEGIYPGILHLQGYGSTMIPAWGYSGDDMAVFCLNIRGHGNSKSTVNPGFPGFLSHFIEDKEQYIYRGAYMDCIRALDFLCSRPEVDAGRLAVEGSSQGGALSIATAALDKRVKLCAPNVPFLGDFPDYFKLANWPGSEFLQYAARHPELGTAGVLSTLSYFDTKNLAPWVHCPVLMCVGLRDNVCPPHTNFAPFNNMTTERQYAVYPEAGHSVPAEHHALQIKWIKENLMRDE